MDVGTDSHVICVCLIERHVTARNEMSKDKSEFEDERRELADGV